MRGEFIDVGGVRLYYYAAGTRGAGEPIVLLHGFPTSGHVWSALVPLMPRGHRLVVVDMLGYGRSDRPGAAHLTLTGHAGRVVDLMDVLGIQQAAVIGHHMGGGVAQAMVALHPERVTRLGLIDSTGFDVVLTGTPALIRALLPLARLVPPALLVRGIRRDLLHRYCDPERGRHSADMYLKPFGSFAGRRTLLRHLGAMSEEESSRYSAALAGVARPVALVWGAHDKYAPLVLASRLQAVLPHATLDIVDDVRHFCPEEAPERVADVIERLMQS